MTTTMATSVSLVLVLAFAFLMAFAGGFVVLSEAFVSRQESRGMRRAVERGFAVLEPARVATKPGCSLVLAVSPLRI